VLRARPGRRSGDPRRASSQIPRKSLGVYIIDQFLAGPHPLALGDNPLAAAPVSETGAVGSWAILPGSLRPFDRVGTVLLADGWHRVKDNSFAIDDAYEFIAGDQAVVASGQVQGVPPTGGASWTDQTGSVMYCPLTAIVAVRVDKRRAGMRLRSIKPTRSDRPR
jgi:hypothetical protein